MQILDLNLETVVDLATLASLIFAIKQLMSANATSASTLSLELDKSIKSAADGINSSNDNEDIQLHVGDLLNTCEVACSLIIDKTVHGYSKSTLLRSINSSLQIINDSEVLIDLVKEIKTSDEVYIHTYYYLLDYGRCKKLGAALMPINAVQKSISASPPWLD